MPLAAFPKCFLNALCADKTMSVDEWIDGVAARLDVDGLEFYWGFTPFENPAELERLRARAKAHGLAIPMMCYSPDFIKPDAAERRAEIERQKIAIAATARLGGKFCRVLSGQRRADVSLSEGVKLAADSIIEAKGLKQISDTGAIEKIVDAVLADNQKSVEEFRAGKEKAFNALVGQVMKGSRGKANPAQVNEILKRKLGG